MTGKKKQMLLAAMAVSAMALQPMAAHAEEVVSEGGAAEKVENAAELDSYTLDDVVVTATRTEKREVDIPEATEVVTAEDIKAFGAHNALDAIRNVNGIIYKSTGPLGSAMGSMTNEIGIRGNDEGALVLVNGNPVSWRGQYNLQEIPADSIERIEIVKGGGSILYGSEAMSGVINVITKKDVQNSYTIGFGNYGQQKYHINAGMEGFSVSYDCNKWKSLKGLTSGDILDGKKNYGTYATDFNNIKNESISMNYKVNDHLDFLYGHYETEVDYDKYITSLTATGKTKAKEGEHFNNRNYQTIRDMAQVNYHDKNWRGSLYFNTGTVESAGPTWYETKLTKPTDKFYNTREKNMTYGFDAQRNWNFGKKSTLIAGFSGQHEVYQYLATVYTAKDKVRDVGRNNWGAFANWEQRFDDKNIFTFGARETWTTSAEKGQNYNNFSMAGQYLHKFDNDNSMYVNVSQSFIMPTLAAMYKADDYQYRANPDLKPQKGINYELGWKRVSGGHLWKTALFHQNVKDKITASFEKATGIWNYTNADFKNTGIEVSCDIDAKNGFSYNYGFTWQNPEEKQSGAKAKKKYWDRKYGKFQLEGGVRYKKDKWSAALTATYLADRVQTSSTEHSFRTKPYLLTSLTVGYAPTELTEINLSIDNVLDRHDVLTHSSAAYYGPGINYMLSITQKF